MHADCAEGRPGLHVNECRRLCDGCAFMKVWGRMKQVGPGEMAVRDAETRKLEQHDKVLRETQGD